MSYILQDLYLQCISNLIYLLNGNVDSVMCDILVLRSSYTIVCTLEICTRYGENKIEKRKK